MFLLIILLLPAVMSASSVLPVFRRDELENDSMAAEDGLSWLRYLFGEEEEESRLGYKYPAPPAPNVHQRTKLASCHIRGMKLENNVPTLLSLFLSPSLSLSRKSHACLNSFMRIKFLSSNLTREFRQFFGGNINLNNV